MDHAPAARPRRRSEDARKQPGGLRKVTRDLRTRGSAQRPGHYWLTRTMERDRLSLCMESSSRPATWTWTPVARRVLTGFRYCRGPMPAPKKPPTRTRGKPSSGRSAGKVTAGSVGGGKVADALRQEAVKKVVEVATKAIGDAAAGVLPAVSRGRELRRARTAAEDYARKIEGRYTDVRIDGSEHEKHYVVWTKDGTPVRAFPSVDGELAELRDVQLVAPSQLQSPPPRQSRRRLRRGSSSTTG